MTLFITGNSRSGTTMMSRILGNHEAVFSFQELHFFDEQVPGGDPDAILSTEAATNLYAKLCSIQRNGYFGDHKVEPFWKEANAAVNEMPSLRAIDVYLKFILTETKLNRKTIPCKQTPQNIFALKELFKNVPDAKVIVMVRDPREVLLSQKNKWKRRKLSGGEIPFWESIRARINYHPITISKIWKATVEQGFKFKENPNVLQVHYEQLISDPHRVIKEVCKHVNISYSPNLLDIPVVGSSNKLDSTNQRGIDTNKTGQWNKGGLNATEIALCESINKSLMRSLGYELSGIKPNLLLQSWYYISMPFRLALALLFNLKRLKNTKKLLKRFFK